jgi:hypothetical protein
MTKERILSAIIIIFLIAEAMGFITTNIRIIAMLFFVEAVYVFIGKRGMFYYWWNWLSWDKNYNNYWEMYG